MDIIVGSLKNDVSTLSDVRLSLKKHIINNFKGFWPQCDAAMMIGNKEKAKKKENKAELRSLILIFIEDGLAGRHRQTTLGKRPWPWQSAVVFDHCGQNISGILVNLARTWQEPGSN